MKIAIDGPSGSGKGTIARLLAEEFNLTYLDTGATYRALAYKILKNNIDLNDKDAIIDIASKLDIKFTNDSLYLDGENITKEIRSMEVTKITSLISSIPLVRKYMVDLQRKLAGSDVVMEGRDITTVVLPDADYKIYLDASLDVRVERRYQEYFKKGIETYKEKIRKSILDRDFADTHREVGSLKRTSDQIYIDTSYMSIDEVVDEIRRVIKR